MNQIEKLKIKKEILLALKITRRLSFIFWFSSTCFLLFLSIFLEKKYQNFIFGFSFGFFMSLINLQLLGYSFLSIILESKRFFLFIIGVVVSFLMLSLSAFFCYNFDVIMVLGFAAGIAFLAFFGIIIAFLRLKGEIRI